MWERVVGPEVAIGQENKTARVTRLYQRHAQMAGGLAYLLTGDVDLAQDLTQEAFARLIIRLPFIRHEQAVPAYLRRSVTNLARKHWRKLGSERRYLLRAAYGTDIAPEADDPTMRDELWRALRKLPFRQRAAIVLRYFDDLSEVATAQVLGCPVGTVKSSVSRGLRQMREELRIDEDTPVRG